MEMSGSLESLGSGITWPIFELFSSSIKHLHVSHCNFMPLISYLFFLPMGNFLLFILVKVF